MNKPKDYLEEIFSRAGRNDKYEELALKGYTNPLAIDGAERFKDELLGRKKKDIKSIDDIASAMVSVGIVSTLEEGKQLVPEIEEASKPLGINLLKPGFPLSMFTQGRYISIRNVSPPTSENPRYLINVESYSLDY